jgi:hypothetical protein
MHPNTWNIICNKLILLKKIATPVNKVANSIMREIRKIATATLKSVSPSEYSLELLVFPSGIPEYINSSCLNSIHLILGFIIN